MSRTCQPDPKIQAEIPRKYAELLQAACGGHTLYYPHDAATGGGVIGDCGYIEKGTFRQLFNVYRDPPSRINRLPSPTAKDVFRNARSNAAVFSSSHASSVELRTSITADTTNFPISVAPTSIAPKVTLNDSSFAFLVFAGPERIVEALSHSKRSQLQDWLTHNYSTLLDIFSTDVVVLSETVRASGWIGGLSQHRNNGLAMDLQLGLPGVLSLAPGASWSREKQNDNITCGPIGWSPEAPPALTIVIDFVLPRHWRSRLWRALKPKTSSDPDRHETASPRETNLLSTKDTLSIESRREDDGEDRREVRGPEVAAFTNGSSCINSSLDTDTGVALCNQRLILMTQRVEDFASHHREVKAQLEAAVLVRGGDSEDGVGSPTSLKVVTRTGAPAELESPPLAELPVRWDATDGPGTESCLRYQSLALRNFRFYQLPGFPFLNSFHLSSETYDLTSKITISRRLSDDDCGPCYEGSISLDGLSLITVHPLRFADSSNASEPTREVSLITTVAALTFIRHRNILPIVGVCKMSNELCIVAPLLVGSTIDRYLRDQPSACRRSIIVQLAEAIAYLHSDENGHRPTVHGSINAGNVLVTPDGTVIVRNFGFSNIGPLNSCATRPRRLLYLAPELHLPDAVHTPSSDTFAFAMLAWEIWAGAMPFADLGLAHAMLALSNGARPSRPATQSGDLDDHIWSIITSCWAQVPAARPSMELVRDCLEVGEGISVPKLRRNIGAGMRFWNRPPKT